MIKTLYIVKCEKCGKEFETFNADEPCKECNHWNLIVLDTFDINDVTYDG